MIQQENSGAIVYWMQNAQRMQYNQALAQALQSACKLAIPLRVIFVLSDRFPHASLRNFWFMIEGLRELSVEMATYGLDFSVFTGHPPQVVADYARHCHARQIIGDSNYLRFGTTWRTELACLCPEIPIQIIETSTVIPVACAYEKQAWSAAVLRPRIRRLLPHYLAELAATQNSFLSTLQLYKKFATAQQRGLRQITSHGLRTAELSTLQNPQDLQSLLPSLPAVPGVAARYSGGYCAACTTLDSFIASTLPHYGQRSDPSLSIRSHLSPYLHFGQISPADVVIAVLDSAALSPYGQPRALGLAKAVPNDPVDAFVEELVVRRELAINYCYYNPLYDSYDGLPTWARQTLELHVGDKRPYLYPLQALEQAATHDPYWNACQRELLQSGSMHSYMRMYWGKKVLEWCPHPREAYERLLYLNDHWQLDGRDANGYAGIAWCFGSHDRPWTERSIFGKVRYMNAAGLERKFNMAEYCRLWPE